MAAGLLSTPEFLSAVCAALTGGAGSVAGSGDARRMACVSRCWCANVGWWARAGGATAAAEAFLREQRAGKASCWSRAVPSPASARESQRDSRALTILYALLRLGVVGSEVHGARAKQKHVCVHSVGTDAVEGVTKEETLRVFRALRELLRPYRVSKLTVVLNGMDLVVPRELAEGYRVDGRKVTGERNPDEAAEGVSKFRVTVGGTVQRPWILTVMMMV